jgi:hypothetical protein
MQTKSIKFLENSNIEMSFTGKMMTSYGGFSLLAKLFEKIELHENLERIFPVIELSPNSKGVYSKLLKFGLTVIAGGKRFAHSVFLGDSDKIFKELFGVEKVVKSSTAITRMFNKIMDIEIASYFIVELWKYIYDRIIPFDRIKEDYVNFDSKVITRYGNQEGASLGYNSKKKGRKSHHPIIAFMNESKYVINFWNRDGSSSSGNGITEFLKETLNRIDGKLKLKGCIGDSGFYKHDLIEYLEKTTIPYILGVPFYQIIQKEIPKVTDWTEVAPGIAVSEFYFQHKDEKWDKDRRYIIVRQEKEVKEDAKGKQLKLFKENYEISKYRYGCYITSMDKLPVEIWRIYRSRAGDENIIKENTYDFGLEGFSLDNFYATEAAMLVRILFYNIVNFFRREILSEKETKNTLGTLRYKYFVIPALLGVDGHKYVLRLGVKTKKMRSKIKWIIAKIDQYFQQNRNRNAFGVETR